MVPSCERGRVRDGPHRDGLGEGRGEAAREDDRDRVREVPRGDRDSQDDAEYVHESVLAAEDEIGQEAGLRMLLREGVLLDLPPECEASRHRLARPQRSGRI